jgi:hypothetical protein
MVDVADRSPGQAPATSRTRRSIIEDVLPAAEQPMAWLAGLVWRWGSVRQLVPVAHASFFMERHLDSLIVRNPQRPQLRGSARAHLGDDLVLAFGDLAHRPAGLIPAWHRRLSLLLREEAGHQLHRPHGVK